MMGHGYGNGERAYREYLEERKAARRKVYRAIWEWTTGLLLITLALSVLYAAYTGRSLISDVESVIRAVLVSNEPVDTLVPPCVTEDSPGPCYWDARLMGNGDGVSFTVDANQNVTYWYPED